MVNYDIARAHFSQWITDLFGPQNDESPDASDGEHDVLKDISEYFEERLQGKTDSALRLATQKEFEEIKTLAKQSDAGDERARFHLIMKGFRGYATK